MFRAIAAAIADLFSRMRAFSIAPPRVGLTSSSVEGEHISSVDAKIGGMHTPQVVMGPVHVIYLSQITQMVYREMMKQRKRTAVHDTALAGMGEEFLEFLEELESRGRTPRSRKRMKNDLRVGKMNSHRTVL